MPKICNAILLAGLSLPVIPDLSAAEPAEYFRENFRNYTEQAPLCPEGKGFSVGNDPIWADSAELNVNAKEPGFIFKDFQGAAGKTLSAFDLLFDFRFNNDKGEFKVYLKGADGKDKVVVFTPKEVSLDTAKTAFQVPHRTRQWEKAALKFSGGKLDVYVTADRQYKKLFTAALGSFQLKGFNIFAEPEKQFAVSHFLLRSPGALKDSSVLDLTASLKSLTDKKGFQTAASESTPVTIRPEKAGGITVIAGTEKDAVKGILKWSDGTETELSINTEGIRKHSLMAPVGEQAKGTKIDLPDAFLSVKGDKNLLQNVYVRPLLRRYHSSYSVVPEYVDIIRDWEKLPKASEHPLRIEFRRDGQNTQLFLDGSYAGILNDKGAVLQSADFFFKKGASYKDARSDSPALKADPKYYPLDITARPKAKAFVDAQSSLKEGFANVNGIPMFVASPEHSSDVGIARQGMGEWALEVEEYLGRSPFDGLLSEVHYLLPPADYTKAWILCAVDPDPAKDPILTTRIGYYIYPNGSGQNMMADTHTVFPRKGEALPANMKQVGSVKIKGVETPLYLAEIELGTGRVLDLPARQKYLNLDFFGKPWENFEQIDRTGKPTPYSTSAVQIFGITLEQAPVLMDIEQKQPGNVFTQAENPETSVVLKSLRPAKGKLVWEAFDADGKKVAGSSADWQFAKAGEEKTLKIALPKDKVGYFDLNMTLADEKGNVILTHPARFAILAKDERKADKYTSPFATWWFDAHGSLGDFEVAGPLFQKAGIRKASWATAKLSQEEMDRFNVTTTLNLMFPLGIRDLDPATGEFKEKQIRDPKDPKKRITVSGEEYARMTIQENLDKRPKSDHILIWHETAPGYGIPEEMLNMDVPSDPALKERAENLGKYINAAGKIIRKHFPKLKIQIGNSSASIGAATLPLRGGADPQYYDYIGIETPSQVIVPEKLQEVGFQGMMISKDIAEKLGKRKIPANGSWEFTYRCERDMGEQQQAEWYMRDVLISLANDFFLISPGIFFDCSSGYYNGLWGGSGIITRGPYVYPKRAYVAYAALTNVFDRVRFNRQIPTGSTTVYALEFNRADGQKAIALWASRGTVKFKVEFNGKASVREFTMYGAESRKSGNEITVDAGTSPVYLLSDKGVKSVSILDRAFPKDEARAAKSKVVAPLSSLDGITAAPDKSYESTHTKFLPITKPSDFIVKAVKDEEKGDCIEATLDLSKNKDTGKYISEYTHLMFKEPVPVEGNPAAVGVWVKGNSSWGRILFEIEDAEGEVWKTLSTSGWGCDILDWPGNLSVNFDGWNFVAHPLRDTDLFNDHSPGPVSEQWVSEGGNKKIDMPIKLRGIGIEVNRNKLDLLDFKKSEPSVRVKDYSAVYDKEEDK